MSFSGEEGLPHTLPPASHVFPVAGGGEFFADKRLLELSPPKRATSKLILMAFVIS